MLRNISFHLLFVLTIASLLYLGFWQLDRLLWKTELLDNIKNQQNEKPIPFPFFENSNTHDFKRSEITGVFIPDTEMYFYRSNLKGESGFSVLTAFQTKFSKVVYIDVGWIPFREKDLKKIEIVKDKNESLLKGVLMFSKQDNFFSPENDYKKNIWYTMNTEDINNYHNFDAGSYILKLVDQKYSQDTLIEFSSTQMPNNHLEYSITWFSMSFVISMLYFYQIYQIVRK